MTIPLNLDVIRKHLDRYAFSEYELYYLSQHRLAIYYRGLYNQHTAPLYSKGAVIAIRCCIGRRLGHVVVKSDNVDEVLKAIERCYSIAKNSSENPYWTSLPRKLSSSMVERIVDPYIDTMDFERIAKTIDDIYSSNDRMRVDLVNVAVAKVLYGVFNSYGEHVEGRYTRVVFEFNPFKRFKFRYCAATLHGLDTYLHNVYEKMFHIFNSNTLSHRENVVAFLGYAFSKLIHRTIAKLLVAHTRDQGKPRCTLKIGSKVISEVISIVDDGAAPNLCNSRPFDDEGMPTQRKIVVDRGYVQTLLHTWYTANIYGAEPTGNAFRQEPSYTPKPRHSNLIVMPGYSHWEEVLSNAMIIVYDVITARIDASTHTITALCRVLEKSEGMLRYRLGLIRGPILDNIEMLSRSVDVFEGVYAPDALIRKEGIQIVLY